MKEAVQVLDNDLYENILASDCSKHLPNRGFMEGGDGKEPLRGNRDKNSRTRRNIGLDSF